MIPPNNYMKESLVLEVHGYIQYWREKGQPGSRPVCALPMAKQDGAVAAANKAPLPDRSSSANTSSRRATKKESTGKAAPILSSHRDCTDLDTEDAKVLERKGDGV